MDSHPDIQQMGAKRKEEPATEIGRRAPGDGRKDEGRTQWNETTGGTKAGIRQAE